MYEHFQPKSKIFDFEVENVNMISIICSGNGKQDKTKNMLI